MADIRFHDFWRSGAATRVRIALHLKGLPYDIIPHDLRIGEQSASDYLKIAPQGLVPALEYGGQAYTQSLAIIEWLDDLFPDPPLLPAEPNGRAVVRAMAYLIACEIHPLQNLRVLDSLRYDLKADKQQVLDWTHKWITTGFAAMEQHIGRHGGLWCYGDQPSLADCCLIPQINTARRFSVDLSAFPRILAIEKRANEDPRFVAAHPDNQPDAQ